MTRVFSLDRLACAPVSFRRPASRTQAWLWIHPRSGL